LNLLFTHVNVILWLVLTFVGRRGKTRGWHVTQILLNRLEWENGYTEVVNSPTRDDALLDVYFVGPESAFSFAVIFRGSVIIAEYYWK
jgi:hypothetical protein